MKKVLVLASSGVIFAFAASAQKLNDAKVPAVVKSAFKNANPNTVVKWEKEDGNYEAVFTKDGKSMSSVIDRKGIILESETDLMVAELPAAIQSYVKSHYKNAKTKGAAKIVKADGSVNYEIVVNGKELMFDSNSKLIKKAKEEKRGLIFEDRGCNIFEAL